MAYYRVFLGRGQAYLAECLNGGFIGVDYGVREDLTECLTADWTNFRAAYVPIMIAQNPGMNAIGAGLRCGVIWSLGKGMQNGDIVFTRDAEGNFHVGDVNGVYWYAPGEVLPHRRRVSWRDRKIASSSMTAQLRRACAAPLALINLQNHVAELQVLLSTNPVAPAILFAPQNADPEIVDPVAFAMEKHLEDFLVQNWNQIELSRDYVILEDQGEKVGQQFPTETGPIDVLAVSRDSRRLLVIELKRGRASDVVVGQILRYMGYVKQKVATPDQTVEGVVIALDDDPKLRWALATVPHISFYRYKVSFTLERAEASQQEVA